MIPIVTGATGTVLKGLEKNVKKAGTTISVELLRNNQLVRTAHMLRRHCVNVKVAKLWDIARALT